MNSVEMSRTEHYKNAFEEFRNFLTENAIFDQEGKLLEDRKVASALKNMAEYNYYWIQAFRQGTLPDYFNPDVRKSLIIDTTDKRQETIDCIQNMEGFPSVNLTDGQTGNIYFLDYYPGNSEVSGASRYLEDDCFIRNYSALMNSVYDLSNPETAFRNKIIGRLTLDWLGKDAAGKPLDDVILSEKGKCLFNYEYALRSLSGEINSWTPQQKESCMEYIQYGNDGVHNRPAVVEQFLQKNESSIRNILKINLISDKQILEYREKKKNRLLDPDAISDDIGSSADRMKTSLDLKNLEKEAITEGTAQPPKKKTEPDSRKTVERLHLQSSGKAGSADPTKKEKRK